MLHGNKIGGNGNLEDTITHLTTNKKRAYRIAVGKERNNLYKPLEYETNYGYQISNYNSDVASNTFSQNISTRDLSEVYCVEVIIENTSNDTPNVYTDTINLSIGGRVYSNVIPTTSKAVMVVAFDITDVLSGSAGPNSVSVSFSREGTNTTVKSIKIYYK